MSRQGKSPLLLHWETCTPSMEITDIQIFDEVWKMVHEFCNGKGKGAKNSINSTSLDLQNHFLSLSNEREMISAISLCLPAMCSGVWWDTCLSFSNWVRALINCASTFESFTTSQCIQLTVDEWSLKGAACVPDSSLHTASMTSHRRKVLPSLSQSLLDVLLLEICFK